MSAFPIRVSLIRPLVVAAGLCLGAAPALAQHADHQPAARPGVAQPEEVIPYLADTCPISGEKLGGMGAPVVREYDGREVRFCCKMCVPKFEADKESGWKKLDAVMIEAQLPYYPVSTCVVSGEPLTEDGEDIAINTIYKGRLVRFCCKSCVKDFKKDPEAVLERLDAAAAEQQRAHYPLKTCPVSGEELGGMGEPYELVVGNRLVRLCCSGCEEDLLADPMKYLEPLDAAWKEQGLPEPLAEAPHAEHAPGHREEMESHREGHDESGDDDHGG